MTEGVEVASAGYWRAYVVTFFSRERVHVASQRRHGSSSIRTSSRAVATRRCSFQTIHVRAVAWSASCTSANRAVIRLKPDLHSGACAIEFSGGGRSSLWRALLTRDAVLAIRLRQARSPAGLPGAPPRLRPPAYVGSSRLPPLSRADLRALVQDANGERRHDPKQHPEAVIPDFSKPDPLLKFQLSDVAFVYGSKWKQRYFTKRGDDYYPLPAQWDVTHRVWRPYMVQPNTDWWVPHYPADNMQRPTGPLCDGCHSVNYNVQTKRSSSGTSAASVPRSWQRARAAAQSPRRS